LGVSRLGSERGSRSQQRTIIQTSTHAATDLQTYAQTNLPLEVVDPRNLTTQFYYVKVKNAFVCVFSDPK